MAQETVDPTCVATCRQEYRRCLMEKRTREGEVPPDVESRCREALQDCIAACGREPPEPKEEVIACNKIPGAPGRGMCMTMAADAPGATPANIAACKGLAAGQPCGGGDEEKEYLVCYAGKCKKMMLTPDKAAIWAESIKKCEGLAEGAACGEPGKTLACVGGVCKYVDASTPENIAACNGKKEGDACGKAQECETDADCPSGWKCYNGTCHEFVPQECETDADCPDGYFCDDGVCKEKKDEEDGDGEGGVPPEGEEFAWSQRLQELLDALAAKVPGFLNWESEDILGKLGHLLGPLQERIQYLYDYPRGLTPEERERVTSAYVGGIKGGERGRIQAVRDMVSRLGMGGGGYEAEKVGRERRYTREDIAESRTQLAIDEINRRFEELMGTTQMAATLSQIPIDLQKWDVSRRFGEKLATTGMGTDLIRTLMSSEVTPEQLSSGRRAEYLAALQTLVNLVGGGAGQDNTMLQMLMSRWLQPEGQSWSPWLAAYIGQYLENQ